MVLVDWGRGKGRVWVRVVREGRLGASLAGDVFREARKTARGARALPGGLQTAAWKSLNAKLCRWRKTDEQLEK